MVALVVMVPPSLKLDLQASAYSQNKTVAQVVREILERW